MTEGLPNVNFHTAPLLQESPTMIRTILSSSLAIGQIAMIAPTLSAAVLQAGVARIDLTPPLEMQATLGGYGERMSRPAEGVHDRLFAKAVVLRHGGKRFALVTADVLGFPPPVKRAVVEQLADSGWTDAQILLLPSHSHTSIDMLQIHPGNRLPIPQLGLFRRPVYEWTVDHIADVIRQASDNLAPCSVGTAQIEIAGWNTNRRHREGAVDNQLTVTRIDAHDGKPLAALVNWTAHPTFMSADDMWFSGGWPGHLQRTLEALIGSGVTVLYYNGAEGDQRPVARPDSGSSRWERAERYGRELALVAHGVFKRATPRATAVFQYHLQPIELPQRLAHPQFMQTGGAEYGLQGALMEKLLATLVPATTVSGSLRLGDLVIVGVPGELVAELGLSIKQQTATITAATYVTIGGLANEWVSYILPRAEYEQGGYEASVSFYGASLGKTIVAGAVDGVKRLGTPAGD
jgi:neutral ceramidase